MTWLARFPLKFSLEDPIQLNTIFVNSMTAVTPVHRLPARASFTKAALRRGLQQMLQQCQCASIWANKHTDAGCLA